MLTGTRRRPRPPAPIALARTCYDHLAGQLGVGLTEQLCARGHVVLAEEGGEVTEAGAAFLTELGVDLAKARAGRRFFCRPCLDWTERRPHLAGAVGAAVCTRFTDEGWVERGTRRAVRVTDSGSRALRRLLGLTPADLQLRTPA